MRSAKSIVVFLVVIVSLLSLTMVQTEYAFYRDQTLQSEAAARAQMAALVPAVHAEFQSLFENVRTVAVSVGDRGVDFGDGISTRAEMVARLQPAPTGEWTLTSKSFHEKTKIRPWAESYSVLAMKSIKPSDIPQQGAALMSLLDPSKKPFFLWIVREDENLWSAVITSSNLFQSLMDRQKGQIGQVLLLNRQGQILGHPVTEYVGTIVRPDPLVSEIVDAGKRSGSRDLTDPQGVALIGFYEQVPSTNIFVALQRPARVTESAAGRLRWQLLLAGLGLALVGVAALVLVARAESRQGSNMGVASEGSTPSPSAGPMSLTATGSSPGTNASESLGAVLPTPLSSASMDLAKERQTAFKTSASAVAHELNGPLVRILAQAQLLKSKLPEGSPEALKIEALAREGRETIQKLLAFSGEDTLVVEKLALSPILQRVLGTFEMRLQAKGIKLEKHLNSQAPVMGQAQGVQRVLESVLNNAVEALENSKAKSLRIELLDQPATKGSEGTEAHPARVILRISDSGVGIAQDNKSKVSDPFFTTKNPAQHSGLGLSMATGLMKEFGGTLRLSSVEGQGTTVELLFVIDEGDLAAPVVARVAKTPQASRSMPTPLLKRALPKADSPLAGLAKTPPPPSQKVDETPELLNQSVMEEKVALMDQVPDDLEGDEPDEFVTRSSKSVEALLGRSAPSRPEPEAFATVVRKSTELSTSHQASPSSTDDEEKTIVTDVGVASEGASASPPPVKRVSPKIDLPTFKPPKPESREGGRA